MNEEIKEEIRKLKQEKENLEDMAKLKEERIYELIAKITANNI